MRTPLDKECIHCGTPFYSTERNPEFCCGGCEVVFGLLHQQGLDQFYQLKGDQKVRPARERPFQTVETEWIESLISKTEAESDEPFATATVQLNGVTCVGCVWLTETLFHRHMGAVSASVDPSISEGTFTWEKGTSALIDFARELPRYGYTIDAITSDRSQARESRALLTRLGISAAFALNTMAFSLPRYLGMSEDFEFARIFDLVALVSSTLALLIGGSYFFQKAFGAVRQGTIHIDLPIALGLTFAFTGSCIGWLTGQTNLFYFDFVAVFTTLMLGGRYINLLAIEKVSHRLQGQSALAPEITLVDQTRKPTAEIKIGDQFELPPGRALPVIARLENTDGEFSLAWMMGEPTPVLFPAGRPVPAGAVLLSNQPVMLTARENYDDSMVAKLYASNRKPPANTFGAKFLKIYLFSIIVIGLVSGIVIYMDEWDLLNAFQVVISIFVISCPCAIGVAIPLVDRRIASVMARWGVFVQEAGFWANMHKIKQIILDKTGTLTLEYPDLVNIPSLDSLNEIETSALGMLVAESNHPLDRTLQQYLASRYKFKDATDGKIHSVPGLGRLAEFAGHQWTLGKPGWQGKEGFVVEDTKLMSCELARDGKTVAIFEFKEALRPDAISSIRSLIKTLGQKVHILSGDKQSRILTYAELLGISSENAHGELSPHEKELKTAALQPALYLGDGMNDALAFSASTVAGTPVSDRSILDRRASFIFTSQGLSFLPRLFLAARWTRTTIRLIVAFAIIYNILAIAACIAGNMSPLLAAILMPSSSIVSIGIAMRPINRIS